MNSYLIKEHALQDLRAAAAWRWQDRLRLRSKGLGSTLLLLHHSHASSSSLPLSCPNTMQFRPHLGTHAAGFERSGDIEMARQIAHEMRVDGKHILPTTSPTRQQQLPALRPGGITDHMVGTYHAMSHCTSSMLCLLALSSFCKQRRGSVMLQDQAYYCMRSCYGSERINVADAQATW